MAFRILASGQNPVNADWNRFIPTNAVKRSQYGEWTCDRTRLVRIKMPANAKTILSITMSFSLEDLFFSMYSFENGFRLLPLCRFLLFAVLCDKKKSARSVRGSD